MSGPGVFIDLGGGSASGTRQVGMVFKVADLFDHGPEAAPQTNTGLDVNPAQYNTRDRI